MLKNLNPYSIIYGFCDGLGEFLTEDISLDQVEEVVKDCVSEFVWDLNLEYKDDREDRVVDTADDYRYEMAQYQNDIRAVEKLFIESC